jgi:hypothetical protein
MVFSTEDVLPRERLGYWRDAIGVVPHEFASFSGTVRSVLLDDVTLSDFQCDP